LKKSHTYKHKILEKWEKVIITITTILETETVRETMAMVSHIAIITIIAAMATTEITEIITMATKTTTEMIKIEIETIATTRIETTTITM